MVSQKNASAGPFVSNAADLTPERRVAGNAPRQVSKGAAALPPFDRRFQLDFPVVDDPGLRFRQPTAPAQTNDAADEFIMVPVSRATMALAMAHSGVTEAEELVEAALKHYAARPSGT